MRNYTYYIAVISLNLRYFRFLLNRIACTSAIKNSAIFIYEDERYYSS